MVCPIKCYDGLVGGGNTGRDLSWGAEPLLIGEAGDLAYQAVVEVEASLTRLAAIGEGVDSRYGIDGFLKEGTAALRGEQGYLGAA